MSTLKNMDLEPKKVMPIVGIDLGTTNCAVAIYSKDMIAKIIPIGDNGKQTMQSCILWEGGDNFIVGEKAYNQRYKENAIYSAKRNMGSDYVYTLKNDNGEKRKITPVEVSAILLKEIKKRTIEMYGDVNECIITLPAYFNQRQIKDTIKAGEIAGWKVRQVLKEPTSASYVYSGLGYAKDGFILVYDLGGGTFDATYMSLLRNENVPKKLLKSLENQYGIKVQTDGMDVTDQYFCRVLATYGDTRLGGDNIDKECALAVAHRYGKRPNPIDMGILTLRCEEFKKANLSAMDIVINGFKYTVTQSDVEKAVEKVFLKTMELMVDIEKDKISTIVLVGGSTKSEYLRKRLEEEFPNSEISNALNPDSAVAIGAGAVAKAIAGGEGLKYQDVNPLPIGVLLDEKRVEACIQANTPLPYTVKKIYRTMSHLQDKLEIKLYQGLSTVPEECTYLGQVTVNNLPHVAEGERLSITIKFILSAQGQLKIISNVEGIDKEEELIIDNILSVADDKVEDEFDDDFFRAFYDAGKNIPEAKELFDKLREIPEDSEERKSIEDEIFQIIMRSDKV